MDREYSHLLAGDSGILGIGKDPAKVESGLSLTITRHFKSLQIRTLPASYSAASFMLFNKAIVQSNH
jgi:hypothetical protein